MQAQKLLPLSLLYAAGGHIEGRTRFQKLAFLADQHLEEFNINPYDFVPYDYGPFDRSLYDALEYLESEGLLTENITETYGGDKRYDYELTKFGRDTYEDNLPNQENLEKESPEWKFEKIHEISRKVVNGYNDYPISNLIEHVYDEYPDYTVNSVY